MAKLMRQIYRKN